MFTYQAANFFDKHIPGSDIISQLHIDDTPATKRVEYFLQRWDFTFRKTCVICISSVKRFELLERHRGNLPMSIGCPINGRVVDDNHFSIAAKFGIQFNTLRTLLECQVE